MTNLILIGMPASGKSTLGVLVAKALAMNFIDTDIALQSHCGCPLQQLVHEHGTQGFCRIEEQCILSLQPKNTVVATGGSVAMEDQAMAWLKKDGLVVFLNLSLQTLEKRLTNISTRGIAMEKGDSLQALYQRRLSAYLRWADVVVDLDHTHIEAAVKQVMQQALLHNIGTAHYHNERRCNHDH